MQQAKDMLQSALLSMLSGIRHGFFTRDGGVSDGFYTSLNAGLGPSAAAMRARFSATRSGASREPSPALRLL